MGIRDMAASTSRIGGGCGHGKPPAWPAYMSRYEKLERLGAGTNGQVFRAWDTEENRIVAVKQLSATVKPGGGEGPIYSGIDEVARETRYLRACQDIPSVVKLRGTPVVPAVHNGDSFIIMDYAGRLNLRAYMKRRARRWRRRFSEAEVRGIMRQLLEAVRSVHGMGIVHLDIQPENVILDDGAEDRTQKAALIRGGKLKEGSIAYTIGGFGMSRMKERPVVEVLTPYSAPELLLRSREYDGRVDTWGLGCIMADLLSGTGEPTFGRDGDTDKELMSQVFGTVDVQGIQDWPGYSGIAADAKSKLPKKKKGGMEEVKSKLFGGPLRRRFPLWRLSSAGFKVLSGLLETNPAKRLTAAEALQMPWFQKRE